MRAGQGSHQLDHLLGLIYCREGEIDEGITYLKRAHEAAPTNVGYTIMLARALIDSDRSAEALLLSGSASGSTPGEFALLLVAAEAADRLGNAAQSAAIYTKLAAINPSDWRVWNGLGNALGAQGSWDAAIDSLGKAAALNSNEAGIQRNLAAAFRAAGRLEESARTLDAMLVRDPADADCRAALASVLADLGRKDEACEQFAAAAQRLPERADIAISYARSLVEVARFAEAEAVYRILLAGDPADAAAVRELGLLLERTSQLSDLGELLQSARSAGLADAELAYLSAALALRQGKAEQALQALALEPSDRDPQRWHRLRSKIADALDDPRQAFISAEAMNCSVGNYDEWRRRGREYRSLLRSRARVVTSDWCARVPQLPAGRRTPAFMVGFPRSGTTLLDTFLMGHPDVHVLEEIPMLPAAELALGSIENLPECSADELARLQSAYFETLDQHVPAGFDGLVIDKLPLNILGAPLIHALFPGARIIFSLRHPCDAVLSGFMQSFVLNDAMACFLDLEDAADLYDAVLDVWKRSRSNLPLDVHDLRYEDLVDEPVAPLKALFDYLGLEWTDSILDHQATAATRGAVSTPSYDQITQPLNSRASGRWLAYRDVMEPALPTLLKWAESFGYEDRN